VGRRRVAAAPVLPGYAMVRPLGSGGFADVFLYEQDLPRRVVAVKVLASEVLDGSVLRNFNSEADILARLSAHPAIVTVHLASISADGRPYFVMEYCPDSMTAKVRRGTIALGEVLDAGVRIGAALETVHRAGLLHRDVKPSNILITSLGTPVLADFGIAVSHRDGGDVAMSVPWSAPEVLAETTSGTVASEVWSLAATVYTLLAGRSPFEVAQRQDNTREAMAARIRKAVYVPTGRADVPARLERALAAGMAKDPAHRYDSVRAFAEELRWIQYELGIPPTNLDVAPEQWSRAAGLLTLDDSVNRGPVASVTRENSRAAVRAARAAETAEAISLDKDGLAMLPERPANQAMRHTMLGILIGAVAVAAILVVLKVLGLL